MMSSASVLLLVALQAFNIGLSTHGVSEPFSVSKGYVYAWRCDGDADDHAAQKVPAYRPALVRNVPKCTAITPLPDASGGPAGNGFTCTGMAYDAHEGVFYVGNIGKSTPEDEAFASCIVRLSADLSANLGEIDLHQTFPQMEDIQGLTIDTSDDTIWFCSDGEDLVRQITKAGVPVSSFSIKNPNGIAYDSRDDTLWVLQTSQYLYHCTTSGTILRQIPVLNYEQDQIWLDTERNIVYVTVDALRTGSNDVYCVDLSNNEKEVAYTLPESYAIEGISIANGLMYIANDGYYHGATVPVNSICTYDMDECADAPYFDGVDDVLSVPDIDVSGKTLTLIAVFQSQGIGSSSSARVLDRTSRETGYCISITNEGHDLQYTYYKADGIKAWKKRGVISIGKTHMVVVTHDIGASSNKPSIYLDGKLLTGLKEIGTATGKYTSAKSVALNVGNRKDRARGFKGFIFDVHIADSILSPDTVASLFDMYSEMYGIQ